MTKCEDRSGPKWGGKIHRRTIHSLSAVTIAGYIAGYVPSTTGLAGAFVGYSLACALALGAFWWLPGAEEINREWEGEAL